MNYDQNVTTRTNFKTEHGRVGGNGKYSAHSERSFVAFLRVVQYEIVWYYHRNMKRCILANDTDACIEIPTEIYTHTLVTRQHALWRIRFINIKTNNHICTKDEFVRSEHSSVNLVYLKDYIFCSQVFPDLCWLQTYPWTYLCRNSRTMPPFLTKPINKHRPNIWIRIFTKVNVWRRSTC